MQFHILTYTYLLFSNEVKLESAASLSLTLSSASVLFHLTFKPKKENTTAKKRNVGNMRTKLLKKHIHTKMKKRGKKSDCYL